MPQTIEQPDSVYRLSAFYSVLTGLYRHVYTVQTPAGIEWVRQHADEIAASAVSGRKTGPRTHVALWVEQVPPSVLESERVIAGNHPAISYDYLLEHFGLDESFAWTAELLAPYVEELIQQYGL